MRTLCSATAFSFALAVAACTTTQPQPETQGFGDEPEWALNPPEGCGIGSAPFRGNRNLARSASTSRARDALARDLQVLVQGMLTDYAAEGGIDGESFTEERIVNVSRQLVDQTLSGTTVVATHVTRGDSPEFYSLVCMRADTLMDAFASMQALSEAQRQALADRAREEFSELDRQLDGEPGEPEPEADSPAAAETASAGTTQSEATSDQGATVIDGFEFTIASSVLLPDDRVVIELLLTNTSPRDRELSISGQTRVFDNLGQEYGPPIASIGEKRADLRSRFLTHLFITNTPTTLRLTFGDLDHSASGISLLSLQARDLDGEVQFRDVPLERQ